MSKVQTTLTVDEKVMRAVKIAAVRTGKSDSQVIQEALVRDLELDLLSRLWIRNQMPADDAMELAVEAQHATRRNPR